MNYLAAKWRKSSGERRKKIDNEEFNKKPSIKEFLQQVQNYLTLQGNEDLYNGFAEKLQRLPKDNCDVMGTIYSLLRTVDGSETIKNDLIALLPKTYQIQVLQRINNPETTPYPRDISFIFNRRINTNKTIIGYQGAEEDEEEEKEEDEEEDKEFDGIDLDDIEVDFKSESCDSDEEQITWGHGVNMSDMS